MEGNTGDTHRNCLGLLDRSGERGFGSPRRHRAPPRDPKRHPSRSTTASPPPPQVDNPDQRIGEDIASFTNHCISVVVVVVGSLLKLASFIGVLFSISPYLTAFVVAYSLAESVLTAWVFGPRLTQITFDHAKREADFRYP